MLHFTFYTDSFLIGKEFAGCTYGPFIFIRPRYKDDKGLLEHEKVHVKQFWRTLMLHGLFYALSNRYRLKCEVEAYKEQLKYCDNPKIVRGMFASFIATKYNIKDVTTAKAYALLGKQ